MGKNYAIERAKFERQQRQQAEQYRKLGMDEEQIQTMYEFDLATFRSDWRYEKHTQGFVASSFGVKPDDGHSREWWVEEIENPQLALALKGLSKSDLEFITRIVIEKATQMELSEELGISQQAVSKKWRKMKKILK